MGWETLPPPFTAASVSDRDRELPIALIVHEEEGGPAVSLLASFPKSTFVAYLNFNRCLSGQLARG